MRKLIILVVVAALLYGGYWFVGRSQIQSGLTQALADINTGDATLTYDSLATRGFPSRFDTTITNLLFEDPTGVVRWTAPTFQLFALSYRPNEVIAVFPGEQTLVVDGEEFTMTTDDMRASGKVSASTDLAFRTATVEIDTPRIRSGEGAELAMGKILAAMRLTPDTVQTYDIYVEVTEITLPDDIRRLIDPQNQQPPLIQSLRFDSDVTLRAPIALLGSQDPQIAALRVKEFGFAWGDMAVSAIGDVTPDAAGVLDGSITISARNWQQALDLAMTSGILNENNRFLMTGIAQNMDETPQIPDTLTVTLMITDGQMSLGGFPLGPAPILR